MPLPPLSPRRDDDGYALPELLIAMVLGVLVLGVVLYFVATSQEKNNNVFSRVGAIDDTSTSFKVLQDNLRQAYKIAPAPSSGTATSGTLTYQGIVQSGTTYSLHTFQIDCTVASRNSLFKCVQTDGTDGSSQVLLDDLVGPTTSFFTIHAPGSVGLPRVDLTATHVTRETNARVALSSSVQPRNCQTTAVPASGACAFP